MQRVTPTLWLNDQAEALVEFYSSVFENVRIGQTAHYTEAGKEIHGHEAGSVLTIEFAIEGYTFLALNGGPLFQINPAISFFVSCQSEEEIDRLWEKLSEGGKVLMSIGSYDFSQRYGWVSDKFGVSWQLILVDRPVEQKIMPSLLFTNEQAGKAEEAMRFYNSVFPKSSMRILMRYDAGHTPNKEGTVAYGEFTVLGERFGAMDSGRQHDFIFNEGVSLMVQCDTQEEIDTYWERLSAVPEVEACGWLKDKYGVSWQIAPTVMQEMLRDGTPEQLERVMAAFMPMKKFDIAELERAYNQA